MTRHQVCHYCGWKVAKVRHPGDPPTCFGCRELPKRERELAAELERELERYYAGEHEHRR